MSSSISIRPGPSSASATPYTPAEKAAAGSSSFSSFSGSPQTPQTPTTPSAKQPKPQHERRPSLLSPSIARQECTVINIGDPEGPTRLISYLSSGQGFTWNPEIFIPSYIDCDYVPLENRREPVHEIYLSDEEAKSMLPQ